MDQKYDEFIFFPESSNRTERDLNEPQDIENRSEPTPWQDEGDQDSPGDYAAADSLH